MTNGSSNLLKTPPIESTLLVTTEKSHNRPQA